MTEVMFHLFTPEALPAGGTIAGVLVVWGLALIAHWGLAAKRMSKKVKKQQRRRTFLLLALGPVAFLIAWGVNGARLQAKHKSKVAMYGIVVKKRSGGSVRGELQFGWFLKPTRVGPIKESGKTDRMLEGIYYLTLKMKDAKRGVQGVRLTLHGICGRNGVLSGLRKRDLLFYPKGRDGTPSSPTDLSSTGEERSANLFKVKTVPDHEKKEITMDVRLFDNADTKLPVDGGPYHLWFHFSGEGIRDHDIVMKWSKDKNKKWWLTSSDMAAFERCRGR